MMRTLIHGLAALWLVTASWSIVACGHDTSSPTAPSPPLKRGAAPSPSPDPSPTPPASNNPTGATITGTVVSTATKTSVTTLDASMTVSVTGTSNVATVDH